MKSQNLFPMLIKWLFYIWELLEYSRVTRYNDEIGVIVIIGEKSHRLFKVKGLAITIRSLSFIYIFTSSNQQWRNDLFMRKYEWFRALYSLDIIVGKFSDLILWKGGMAATTSTSINVEHATAISCVNL